MKLTREKLEQLLDDVMGFVKDSIATNNRNAESINDLVEINRMLKNECTQEYNDKVRYKKLNDFLIRFIASKFLKPKAIFPFIERLYSRTTLATIFVVIILILREVILQREILSVSIKRNHFHHPFSFVIIKK